MAYVLLEMIATLFLNTAYANSCCGQSPASFTVLALEQSLSLNTSYSYIESQGRVFNDSEEFFIWQDRQRQIESLALDISGSLAPRHQFFINAAILSAHYKDNFESARSQNLSDTQVGYTFEALSEYRFSFWRPVVYLSAIVNLPTGNSIYDEEPLTEGTAVTGHNQWGAGIGLTLRKTYFPLTLTLQLKSLRIFTKEFDGVRVSDFFDSSLALLGNYATQFYNVSFNLGLTMNWLSERRLPKSQVTSGQMRNSTVLFGVQKPFSEAFSGGATYADQTLLGPAQNTILNRTITVNLNYNYF